jgi:hypothetical protein
MFYGINEVAVIVSAILALAIGSVWYSPLLFGKPWMEAVGLTPQGFESSEKNIPKLFLWAALSNVVALFVLAYLTQRVHTEQSSVLELSLWLSVMVSALFVGSAIWEQKPLSYMYINIGYFAVVIIGGAHVIALWPW